MILILDGSEKIAATLSRLEQKVDAIATDIANLTTAVTAVTADVTAVLGLLKAAPNITPEQQQQLEAQIAALNTVDATLKAAIPTPAPAPTPTPTPTS